VGDPSCLRVRGRPEGDEGRGGGVGEGDLANTLVCNRSSFRKEYFRPLSIEAVSVGQFSSCHQAGGVGSAQWDPWLVLRLLVWSGLTNMGYEVVRRALQIIWMGMEYIRGKVQGVRLE